MGNNWRTRTTGTDNQVGKPFIQQPESRATALPTRSGKRLNGKKLGAAKLKQYIASLQGKISQIVPSEKNIIDKEFLTPTDVDYLAKNGYATVDEDDELRLTLKGQKLLMSVRADKKKGEDEARKILEDSQ